MNARDALEVVRQQLATLRNLVPDIEADSLADTALAVLTNLVERAGEPVAWMPIETAPVEGEFLVYLPNERRKIQAAHWHPNTKIIGSVFAFDLTKPTHWQPLPTAPGASHER